MPTKHLCVLIHDIIYGEVGTVKLVKALEPFSYRPCQGCGSFSLFSFVFANTRCLFVAVLRSPVGEGLTSWLSCM